MSGRRPSLRGAALSPRVSTLRWRCEEHRLEAKTDVKEGQEAGLHSSFCLCSVFVDFALLINIEHVLIIQPEHVGLVQ